MEKKGIDVEKMDGEGRERENQKGQDLSQGGSIIPLYVWRRTHAVSDKYKG